jgi:fused signal recognition particle receptor
MADNNNYWVLLVLALLIGAAYYLPTLRRRQRDRRRKRERDSQQTPTAGPDAGTATLVDRTATAPPKPVGPPIKPLAKAPPVKAPPVPAPPAGPRTPPPPATTPPPPPAEAPPAPAEPEVLEPEVVEPGVLGPEVLEPEVVEPAIERPEPTAGRLVRLRARLSRSQNVFGKGLLALLSRDKLDEDTWEELEETLITADVGVEPTRVLVERLRDRARVLGTDTATDLRALLAEELLGALEPDLDRTLRSTPTGDRPAVLLVVGVNGSGKTTTCGKIARVLVADGRSVLLGAADTFRAAAAEQLATWAGRVGAEVVRGPEGGDPAAVAFDAVKRGTETRVDTVLIDTAGRLQNKVGLMDELGKVKRVLEKQGPVDETLLVLDATTGQNGLEQARVFTEVVNVTGVVLTKLDGTAKGGIVIAVQRKLGIPVKLVGLGEGPDDLAPFEPKAFVDALLGD